MLKNFMFTFPIKAVNLRYVCLFDFQWIFLQLHSEKRQKPKKIFMLTVNILSVQTFEAISLVIVMAIFLDAC